MTSDFMTCIYKSVLQIGWNILLTSNKIPIPTYLEIAKKQTWFQVELDSVKKYCGTTVVSLC